MKRIRCQNCGEEPDGTETTWRSKKNKRVTRIACACGCCGPWGGDEAEAWDRWNRLMDDTHLYYMPFKKGDTFWTASGTGIKMKYFDGAYITDTGNVTIKARYMTKTYTITKCFHSLDEAFKKMKDLLK